MNRVLVLTGVVIAATAGVTRADGGSVVPAAWQRARPTVAPIYCPPVVPGTPQYLPGVTPGVPATPPGMLPGMTPTTPPGMVPPDPGMPAPAVPPGDAGGPAAGLLGGAMTSPFATQTEGGGTAGRSFNESFDGDFGGVFYARTVVSGTVLQRQQIGTRVVTVVVNPGQDGVAGTGDDVVARVPVPVFGQVPVPNRQVFRVVALGRYQGVQITDNDSPRPTDRLYFGYNYYDNLGTSLAPGVGNITQNRETVGFEKTFLNGDASFGLRLPFVQLGGPLGVAGQSVGDLSVLVKYALINDRATGNVVSVGLVLTTPTAAAGGTLADGSSLPNSVLFQPWAGFVRTFSRAYVQGITNVIVPTDGRDPVLLSNSLAAGYWLYRADDDRLLNGVIPTIEVHVRTPLNQRDPNGLVFLQDQVNITGGLHIRFPRATLSGAICVPTVGPRPWNVEAIANLTFRF